MARNKNIIVTGSSRGIGLDTAKRFCEGGYNVFITGRNDAVLAKIAENIGAMGYFACDLASDDGYLNLYNAAKEKIGPINVLVNNAGGYLYAPIEDVEMPQIENLMNLNFRAPYALSQLCIADMKENRWGRIINIGSISGSVGEANASLYSATKSALIGMTKALALELAQYDITVNTVNPGWVDTELAKEALSDSGLGNAECIDMIPQRRFVEPCEISALVNYLASDEAKGVTGQIINVCAGLSLG